MHFTKQKDSFCVRVHLCVKRFCATGKDFHASERHDLSYRTRKDRRSPRQPRQFIVQLVQGSMYLSRSVWTISL